MTKQERVAMGHRLRQQRTLLGLTREEFAELADISAGYYGQIEVGTSQMSIDTLIKLSKTSQLSMEYILLGEEIQPDADLTAIEALLARCMQLPTVIFDEIDTGVSGRIADAMGEIIESLSATMQVVDITHLPQVASKGSAHFVVYKQDGRTGIRRLTAEERITEIAKMLSGSRITDAAVAQARILLGK